MVDRINEPITSGAPLRDGFLIRDGFVFTITDRPSIFDTLVIRVPHDAVAFLGHRGFSDRTLSEHIALINEYQLEKIIVICNDLSFITQCPSVKHVSVYPADTVGNGFDFSPLYHLPNLVEVNCCTEHGIEGRFRSNIDYAKFHDIKNIAVTGSGHIGYDQLTSLEEIWISNDKKKTELGEISNSSILRKITLMQCAIQSLNGIEKFPQLSSLVLYNNRRLSDISALANVSNSLKTFAIESSFRVSDFTVLSQLVNLEHLHLYGHNSLPNLHFLKNMKKLKTFCFTMNVEDGDLTLCRNLPYASCKNRRHYNLRDDDLPKDI